MKFREDVAVVRRGTSLGCVPDLERLHKLDLKCSGRTVLRNIMECFANFHKKEMSMKTENKRNLITWHQSRHILSSAIKL